MDDDNHADLCIRSYLRYEFSNFIVPSWKGFGEVMNNAD